MVLRSPQNSLMQPAARAASPGRDAPRRTRRRRARNGAARAATRMGPAGRRRAPRDARRRGRRSGETKTARNAGASTRAATRRLIGAAFGHSGMGNGGVRG